MTQLKCSAQTCMYNEDRYCCKGEILVEGRDAKESGSTYCASFRERGEGRMSNSMVHPTKNVDVDCEAVSCVFNEGCKCSANEIGIGGSHACQCQDTECASFQCSCK